MGDSKLTDEKMLKALGWKWEKTGWLGTKSDGCRHYGVYWKGKDFLPKQGIPKFTTSVDAIFSAVESLPGKPHMRVETAFAKHKGDWIANFETTCSYGPTAPLALCNALLKYLAGK